MPIIFFSARERVEFNKSCNLIGSWSRRNLSSWSIFFKELAVIVNLSPFLHFRWRLINDFYSPLDGKESRHKYMEIQLRFLKLWEFVWLFVLSLYYFKSNWINFCQVYFSDHCFIWKNFCGVHLMNFLAKCHSIYSTKVWFRVIRNDWQKLFLLHNLKLCTKFHTENLENLTGDFNAN